MDRRQIARVLGRRGGEARARRLDAAERRRIAALGGKARHRSLTIARRVAQNFEYAAAVAELGGTPRAITRMKTFAGRLPGIYPDRS